MWHDGFASSALLVPFKIWVCHHKVICCEQKNPGKVGQETQAFDRQTFARKTIGKFHFRSQ